MNYYNEIDPHAAAWLRELITQRLIPAGEVDTRSIEDVRPDDLRSFAQCHFFAGIGGWSLALALAEWPSDAPVWTGSCPCQPFSAAGKGEGFADERHLWPAWHWLIEQCRPATIFGEQVASRDGLGWFDVVSADLEGSGYTVGAADICAAGLGAPHLRNRLWFVADAEREGLQGHGGLGEVKIQEGRERASGHDSEGGLDGGLGDTNSVRRTPRSEPAEATGYGDTPNPTSGDAGSPWGQCDWLPFKDGKIRPVEPRSFPLAHGLPRGLATMCLRGYGNAIVPQVAARFIYAAGGRHDT